MTVTDVGAGAAGAPWTCPFCPLLCDTFGVSAEAGAASLALQGADCARARAGLAQFAPTPVAASPRLDGQPCVLDDAIAAAAALLSASRQPLFGGLGTDVAGARALYTLACETGAICDAANSDAMMQGLRALQDRGRFSVTLAEVRERADLVVCIGGDPSERYPLFLARCGLGAADPRLAMLLADDGRDLFDTVALLAAAVEGRAVPAGMPAALAALAERLHAARYAVIVYETGRLPAHGALVIEAINRVVATLNRRTRAAALALAGGEGASAANEVFTWLSGLPLRSRAGPAGLEHEPLRFGTAPLLADGAVDAVLWVSSFVARPVPDTRGLPRIVLGHPAMASRDGGQGVFIPVSTPGIGTAGHLFRVDGLVVVPLRPAVPDTLPTVAEVIRRLTAAVQALQPGQVTA